MKKKINFSSYIYAVTLFFIALSGFAQMPIFKRYYIADIPGLWWLADFYVTHLMHYIFATVFMGLAVYLVADALFFKKGLGHMPGPIKLQAFFIAGLIVTGILLVVKNFPGTPFPGTLIIVLDISHLLLCMGLLLSGLYQLIKTRKALLSQ